MNRFATLPSALFLFLAVLSAGAQSADDGFKNPLAGLSGGVAVVALQPDGKILIARSLAGGNNAGLARLHADGSWDTNFVAPQIFNYLPARAIVVQEDGRIVVGASFYPGGRTNLARLLPDGALDATFAVTDRLVESLLLLPGGKILAGGNFGVVRLNGDGSLDGTFTNSVSAGGVRAMTRQPDGKIMISGGFTGIAGQMRRGLARLNADGSLNAGFDPGSFPPPFLSDYPATSLALQPDGRIVAGFPFHPSFFPRRLLRFYPDGTHDGTLSGVSNAVVRVVAVQADGKILVGGSFTNLLGQPRTHLARLKSDGSLDMAFAPNISNNQSPLGVVGIEALALQPDGQIIVAGSFTNLAGHARSGIGRLYPDGRADATLNPTANDGVLTVAVQPDGKILVGGSFTNMAGEARNRLARLYPDGTLDAAFNPGAGASIDVRSLALQRDGRILVGGEFTALGGQPRGRLGRLDADGNLDPFFNPGANNGVRALAIQADDKIIVGGGFTNIAGHARNRIARLNPDGSIDPAFDPGADDWVRCAVVLPDGRILVGGDFRMLGGQPRELIGRLYPDGSLDPTFNPGANGHLRSFALDASGKVVVAGLFRTLAGQPCSFIGRLNPDGTLDTSFGSGASQDVWAATLQADGRIIAGGFFLSMNGQPRSRIARLSSGSAAFQSLAIDATGTVVTWARGGAAPEVDLVTFEQSTDGTNYAMLGHAARITGGWQLTGALLPIGEKFYVRARGRSFGGTYNGSSGIIESVAQFYRVAPPNITSASRFDAHGFEFAFMNSSHHPYTVLAATNLPSTSWDILGFATNAGSGLYQFSDHAASSLPRRFYQLRGP